MRGGRICRHCQGTYDRRTGRGLCRPCWNDPAIRNLYPPICAFGAPESRTLGKQLREAMNAGESNEATEVVSEA